MSAYFITSTGTDIGKTYVTAGLIRHARLQGKTVSALKPVISGFDPAQPEPSDTAKLLQSLGEEITPASLARLSPYRFAAPLSPDMAAAREGRSVPFDALVSLCALAARAHQGTLFIEGVGGVMVPLDESRTVLDWMAALGLPLVMVTGSYLGTISHTLTALDVVARRGLKVAALVVNQSPGDAPLGETMAVIARFAPTVAAFALPRRGHAGDSANADFGPLWQGLARGGDEPTCSEAGGGV
ncbi:MAG TPA: dethiobiotin synthase [Rhizomicrobium sp.]|nr:dethiobiotin synthase [Rhizomicrobium sp.]